MEVLDLKPFVMNSNWFYSENRIVQWTPQENKQFENALALYDKETEDRWIKIAAMIPGKTIFDVMKRYKNLVEDINEIEAGLVPIPGYNTSTSTLEWTSRRGCDGFKQSYGGKKIPGRPDPERRKGIPWTEEEHRLFLKGLKKYGKGDWRNISRNFVVTKTPTQVASHAQKYFIRLNSVGKDKRRSSIHDITTLNISENGPPSENHSPQALSVQTISDSETNFSQQIVQALNWHQSDGGATVINQGVSQTAKNIYMIPSYGVKYETQDLDEDHGLCPLDMDVFHL